MDYSKAVKGKFKYSNVLLRFNVKLKILKILLKHIQSIRAVQSNYLEVEPPIQRIVSKVYLNSQI